MSIRHCIIIGAGPGMGYSLARKFSGNGLHVHLVARNIKKLEAFRKELKSERAISIYSCNVSNEISLAETLDAIVKDIESVDLLIYNVSVLNPGKPSEIELDLFEDDFRVNVKGLLICYQKLFESLSKNKGTILVTGGGLSLNPFYEYTSLGVGKAGIRNLTFNLAQEGKQHNIQVATITILGMIEKGSHFDPNKIAELFWKVFNREIEEKAEYLYQ